MLSFIMTLKKADLAEAVRQKLGGVTKREADDLVDIVVHTLKRTLASGENVKVTGFGSFVVREKRERVGRNPQNGEKIVIAGRRVVAFKASPVLREKLR